MYCVEDLVNACYSNNYLEILKVLDNLEKTEYLSNTMMDCFIGGMKFLHQDLMIKFLHHDERLAIEFFEDYDIFSLLYSLELGLNKLSMKIMEILEKYDKYEDKKSLFKLRYENSKYKTLVNQCNCNKDNILTIALYANNIEIVPKIIGLKSYGEIDYSHKNNISHNALIVSINSNMLKTAYDIMEKYNEEELNYIDYEGNSAFLYVIINRQYDFMIHMIKYKRCKINLDAINYLTGNNALHFLCEYKEQLYSSILIEHCPSLVYMINIKYEYPLLIACINSLLITISKILKNIEESNIKYYMFSVLNNDFKSVKNDYRILDLVDKYCIKNIDLHL